MVVWFRESDCLVRSSIYFQDHSLVSSFHCCVYFHRLRGSQRAEAVGFPSKERGWGFWSPGPLPSSFLRGMDIASLHVRNRSSCRAHYPPRLTTPPFRPPYFFPILRFAPSFTVLSSYGKTLTMSFCSLKGVSVLLVASLLESRYPSLSGDSRFGRTSSAFFYPRLNGKAESWPFPSPLLCEDQLLFPGKRANWVHLFANSLISSFTSIALSIPFFLVQGLSFCRRQNSRSSCLWLLPFSKG